MLTQKDRYMTCKGLLQLSRCDYLRHTGFVIVDFELCDAQRILHNGMPVTLHSIHRVCQT